MTSTPGAVARRRWVPWPLASFLLMAATVICTLVARNGHPEVYHAVLRDRSELLGGDWWRLISPLLVQPDPWPSVIFLVVYGFGVYALAEKQLGAAAMLTLAIGGSIPAELVGAWWAEGRSGCSVAGMAVVSGLSVLWALDGRRRWVLIVQIIISLWELINADLHGVACVAGFVIALLMWWSGLRPQRSGLELSRGRLRRVRAEAAVGDDARGDLSVRSRRDPNTQGDRDSATA